MRAVKAVITTALIILLGLYVFQAVFSLVRFGGIHPIHLVVFLVVIVAVIIWFRTGDRRVAATRNPEGDERRRPTVPLKARPYSWQSLTLIVVVTMLSAISLGVFVVRPVVGVSWPTGDSGRSYQPSFSDDSESFIPSRVVTYQELVGLTVAEANELLGYGKGRNVYPHLPRLVGTSPMGSESPDGYSEPDLFFGISKVPADRLAESGSVEPRGGVQSGVCGGLDQDSRR